MTDQEIKQWIKLLENRIAKLETENAQLRKDLKLLQSDLERKTNQFYFKP